MGVVIQWVPAARYSMILKAKTFPGVALTVVRVDADQRRAEQAGVLLAVQHAVKHDARVVVGHGFEHRRKLAGAGDVKLPIWRPQLFPRGDQGLESLAAVVRTGVHDSLFSRRGRSLARAQDVLGNDAAKEDLRDIGRDLRQEMRGDADAPRDRGHEPLGGVDMQSGAEAAFGPTPDIHDAVFVFQDYRQAETADRVFGAYDLRALQVVDDDHIVWRRPMPLLEECQCPEARPHPVDEPDWKRRCIEDWYAGMKWARLAKAGVKMGSALYDLPLRKHLDLVRPSLKQLGDELDLQISGEREVFQDGSGLEERRTLIRGDIGNSHRSACLTGGMQSSASIRRPNARS